MSILNDMSSNLFQIITENSEMKFKAWNFPKD